MSEVVFNNVVVPIKETDEPYHAVVLFEPLKCGVIKFGGVTNEGVKVYTLTGVDLPLTTANSVAHQLNLIEAKKKVALKSTSSDSVAVKKDVCSAFDVPVAPKESVAAQPAEKAAELPRVKRKYTRKVKA